MRANLGRLLRYHKLGDGDEHRKTFVRIDCTMRVVEGGALAFACSGTWLALRGTPRNAEGRPYLCKA